MAILTQTHLCCGRCTAWTIHVGVPVIRGHKQSRNSGRSLEGEHVQKAHWRNAEPLSVSAGLQRRPEQFWLQIFTEKLAEMIKHPSSRPPRMSITARTNYTHDTGMGKKRATNEALLDLLRCLQRKQNKQTAC